MFNFPHLFFQKSGLSTKRLSLFEFFCKLYANFDLFLDDFDWVYFCDWNERFSKNQLGYE